MKYRESERQDKGMSCTSCASPILFKVIKVREAEEWRPRSDMLIRQQEYDWTWGTDYAGSCRRKAADDDDEEVSFDLSFAISAPLKYGYQVQDAESCTHVDTGRSMSIFVLQSRYYAFQSRRRAQASLFNALTLSFAMYADSETG